MSSRYKLYNIIRKIHLYASLSTVVFLLMYLVTSYMMMYHSWFNHDNKEQVLSVKVNPSEISDENWDLFIDEHAIKGRLVRENYTESGDLNREYSGVGINYKIKIFKNKNEVEIKSTKLNLFGTLIGFHRLSGFGGPLQYNLYALFLDLVGFSLILFAITGVILWLKLLKNDKIAWIILALGFVYVSFIVGYLLIV